MDSLLKEINMLPGVFGCFVYTGNQELAAAKLPQIFKEHTIKTMGNFLTRALKMGGMANEDLFWSWSANLPSTSPSST